MQVAAVQAGAGERGAQNPAAVSLPPEEPPGLEVVQGMVGYSPGSPEWFEFFQGANGGFASSCSVV